VKKKKLTKEQKSWQRLYPKGKACLSWNLTDYQIWKITPPECLLKNPYLTEGQQMSDGEIEDWFINSIKTLKILKEQEPEIFQRLYQGLILDIEYLISIKRVPSEYLNFVLDKKNFEF